MSQESLIEAKARMLREHLGGRGISDDRVLAAFAAVPREEFVPGQYRDQAYIDAPLEIGEGQTISQPYTVAFMTQLLDPEPGDIILEVGTGSGYQAAILSRLVAQVYTIERFGELAKNAAGVLKQLGYRNVEVSVGDGSTGLPDKAPFDGVVVTAAAPKIPQPLLDQLKVGGRMVLPVGETSSQDMMVITKTETGTEERRYPGFRFVPLVGEHGFEE